MKTLASILFLAAALTLGDTAVGHWLGSNVAQAQGSVHASKIVRTCVAGPRPSAARTAVTAARIPALTAIPAVWARQVLLVPRL